MPPHNLANLLADSPAFSGLPPEILERAGSLLLEQQLAPGTVLGREGGYGDKLFLVIEGSLGLQISNTEGAEPQYLAAVSPGEITGELALLTGYPRAATIFTKEQSVVAELSRADFELLCREYPEEMASVVGWMRGRMHSYQVRAAMNESSLLKDVPEAVKSEIETGFQWKELHSGETLFRQEDIGDALYLIVSGRIQLVRENDAADMARSERILKELGPGEMFGEMALLTGKARSATAYAIRDTQLVYLDRQSFDRIVSSYPKVMLELFACQLADRLSEENSEFHPTSRAPVCVAILTLVSSRRRVCRRAYSQSRRIWRHHTPESYESRRFDFGRATSPRCCGNQTAILAQ